MKVDAFVAGVLIGMFVSAMIILLVWSIGVDSGVIRCP
jgi:hypothetical protein